jgi:hypothetical protein
MPNNKELKIGVSIDQSSTNNTLSSVRVLIKEFERLAGALQNASKSMGSLLGGGAIAGGGQTPGALLATTPFKGGSGPGVAGGSNVGGNLAGGGLASLLNQNTQAFRQMAQASEQFGQAMATSLRRNIDSAKASLEGLKGEINEASSAFNSLSPSAQAGPSGQALQAGIASRIQKAGGLVKQVSDGEKAIAAMAPEQSAGFDWRGFGKAAGRAGGIALAGGAAIGTEYLQTQNDFVQSEARLGRTWGQAALATRRGNLGYVNAMNQIMSDPDKRREFANLAGADAATFFSGLGQNPLQILTSGGTSVLRSGMTLDVQKKEALFGYMQQQMNTFDFQNNQAFIDKLQSEGGSRMGAMRALGIGGRSLQGMAVSAMKGYGFGSDMEAIGALGGAAGALAPFVGRRTGAGKAFKMLNAMMGGMDSGQAAAMMGSDIITGGNLTLAAAAATGKSGMDIRSTGILASAAAQASLESGGYVGGDALFAAMSSGLGNGPADVFLAKERAQALGATSMVMGGGGDGFGNANNSLAAMTALRKAGVSDVYSIGELTKAMQDPALMAHIMQGGTVPERLKNLGITPDIMKSAYQESITRQMHGRLLDSGANTVQAAFNRDFDKMGGLGNASGIIQKYGAGKGGMKKLITLGGTLLRSVSPDMYKSPLQAEATFANLLGMQNPRRRGRGARTSFGDAAGGSLEMAANAPAQVEAQAIFDQMDHLSPQVRGLKEAAAAQQRGVKLMGDQGMAGLHTSAENVTESFQDLGAATRALATSMKDIVKMTGHQKDLERELGKVTNARAKKAQEQKSTISDIPSPHEGSLGKGGGNL